jgi:hypothetical protein
MLAHRAVGLHSAIESPEGGGIELVTNNNISINIRRQNATLPPAPPPPPPTTTGQDELLRFFPPCVGGVGHPGSSFPGESDRDRGATVEQNKSHDVEPLVAH